MTYQALARKYRPDTFKDLIGQEDVVKALTNAVRLKREPSALIFTGTRGVGKTTTARLFAKSLNCEQGPTEDPCGLCYSCKAISGSYHEDVIEIDGASNNGVAEVRALQETLSYTPQRSSFKIYIVDEVHMLSSSAFNALLKTLEEPPDKVIFIFATTEIHKVPKTVLSRCQTFYMNKVSSENIQKRLSFVLKSEKITFDSDVLPLVAREGCGSVRDALTFLDQIIAIGGGDHLSVKMVNELSKNISIKTLCNFIKALNKRDAKTLLSLINEIDSLGIDYEPFVSKLAVSIRHSLVLPKLGVEKSENPNFTREELDELSKIGKEANDQDLHALFRLFVLLRDDLSGSSLDRCIFENHCLEWCLGCNLQPDISSKANPNQEIKNSEKVETIEFKTTSYKTKSNLPLQIKDNDSQATKPDQDIELEKSFPNSWNLLVEIIKKTRPIQGRKLEETYLLKYSSDSIVVAVDESSFVGAELLREAVQQRWLREFNEQFNFKGSFKVIQRSSNLSDSSDLVSESLLDKKVRDKEIEKKKIFESAIEHPITQSLINNYGGKIRSIELKNK